MNKLLGLCVVGLFAFHEGVMAREPIEQTPAFDFYSHFETNLNDALLNAGVDRRLERAEMFQAGAEKECFESLPRSLQAGWNRAVDYYAEIISPHDFDDRQQALIRLHLADIPMNRDERRDQFLMLVDSFMTVAAPAYRACRWESQDEKNRKWLAKLMPLLREHENSITSKLSALFQAEWPKQPLEIDIVETVSWAGANSFFPRGSSGHILIAPEPGPQESLELVFHEASHGFMLPGAPLFEALAEAAEKRGIEPPQGLWHVVLFVTTGETVRAVLESAGIDGYEPMIFEIYPRSPWGRYQEAMEAVWPGYLDGEQTADDAMAALINRIGTPTG